MPNKYAEKKGWRVPKQRYKLNNWPEYNEALRQRGNIAIWINDDVMTSWYERDRIYDGTGASKLFSDFAITICHELRQVFKLPLRQCQGFIDSIFQLQRIFLQCPDYSCLSKRLATLNLHSPRYKKSDTANENIAAIAIDSTGLKRFGRDEWHQEKHRISANRSWRKFHIAVDEKHIIHAAALTDRFVSDDSAIDQLVDRIDSPILQVNADGAYDKNSVYEKLSSEFDGVSIIIPPSRNAIYSQDNHIQRNRNLQSIKTFGRMPWQRATGYGHRKYSELAIQRYKRILVNKLHSREMSRQINEAMIGAGCLNKMTRIGMPKSYRCA